MATGMENINGFYIDLGMAIIKTTEKNPDKDNKNNDTSLNNVWNNIKRRDGKKKKKVFFDLSTNIIRKQFRINTEDISSDNNKTHEVEQLKRLYLRSSDRSNSIGIEKKKMLTLYHKFLSF